MKKIFATSLLALMAFAGAAWAIEWTQENNIAAGKQAYVSSARNYAWDKASSLTDGNGSSNGDAWQALGTQEGGASVNDEDAPRKDWAYVDLGKTYQLSSVDPNFGDCFPEKFEVYATNTNPEGTFEAENWTKIGEGTGMNGEVNISVSDETAYRFVGILVTQYSELANQWGTNINELRMTGEVKIDYTPELSALTISASATEAYTDGSVQLSCVQQDQKGNIYDGEVAAEWVITKEGTPTADAAISAEGILTTEVPGKYEVSLKSGEVVSNTLTITFSINPNIAKGAKVTGTNEDGSVKENLYTITDGNLTTFNEVGGIPSTSAEGYDGEEAQVANFLVDLGALYELNSITVCFEAVFPTKFSVAVSGNGTDFTPVFSSTVDTDNAQFKLTTDNITGDDSDVLKEVQFIKVLPLTCDNPWNATRLAEVMAEGSKVTYEPELTAVALTTACTNAFVNEAVALTATFTDQKESALEPASITWSIKKDGEETEDASIEEGVFKATAAGVYAVCVTATDAKGNSLSSDEVSITVIVDENIAKDAKATITNNDEEGANFNAPAVTDGNLESFNEVAGVYNTTAEGYADEQNEKGNAVIDLGGHYDLSSIAVFFGEFYPTLFDVAVSADGETYIAVKEGETVAQNNARFIYETEAKGIQYIKLTPRTSSNIYAVARIYEVKAYGELAESDKIVRTSEEDAAVETYAGVWVDGIFTGSEAKEVDMTAVTNLPDKLPALATPNALYYVSAAAPEALKEQPNVVVETIVEDEPTYAIQSLVLEDGKSLTFTKAEEIAVSEGIIKRTLAKGEYAAIYLPFGIKNEGAVMTYFPNGTSEDKSIATFGTNGEGGVLGAYVPAVLVAQDDLAELKSAGAFTLNKTAKTFESILSASTDFQTLTGEAVAGGYDLKGTAFTHVDETAEVLPFHSFIAPGIIAVADVENILVDVDGTIITAVASINDKGQATGVAIYDLAGQRVSIPQKGIYIVNGKKYLYK